MKILSVVGARPQFVKEAAVGRELRLSHEVVLVHTGQHYDANMSDVFFEELGIPRPDFNLGIGGGGHGAQTGQMLTAIEEVLLAVRPDWTLVYGDTNSTLAATLASVKLHVPVAHVEAGLRSYDRRMPEEVNRVLTDHASDLLFAPGARAIDQLRREGITSGVHMVGDVMIDALAYGVERARSRSEILSTLGLTRKEYLLATLHRPSNVDDPAALARIMRAFGAAGDRLVFPLHPRTRARLAAGNIEVPKNVELVSPLGYLDFLALQEGARKVLTDSGGVQKEAYELGVACVTLRDTTEWPETVDDGWNVLVHNDPGRIEDAIRSFQPTRSRSHPYGGRGASRSIVQILDTEQNKRRPG